MVGETTSELHPEDMLDAVRRGSLDARSRRDLQLHLGRCGACRMQLALAMDFDVEAQSQRADTALMDEMVQQALVDTPRIKSTGALRSGFARSASPLRRLILPAVCLLLGGGVATGMWSVRRERSSGPTIEEMPRTRDARPRVRNTRAVTSRLAMLSPAEEADLRPREVPAPVAPPPVAMAPAPKAQPRPTPAHRHLATAVTAPAEAAPSAPQLFADANKARRAGDYPGALTQYQALSKRFPGSREELTGRIIVGELALARHAPGEALRQFDSYLGASPSGTLAEEARVGRATALGALDRPADERDAWQDLLRRHPASVHAQRARDRLNQLR